LTKRSLKPPPHAVLELFHSAPSYYSMVARLALCEAHLPFTSRLLDIHLARQQLSPAYGRLNPHMTVPTLRGPGLLLTDSEEILRHAARHSGSAWADDDSSLRPGIAAAVAGHYALSIETLTFSRLLAGQPWLTPLLTRLLTALVRTLEQQARSTPDGGAIALAKANRNRERLQIFAAAPAEQTLAAQRAQVADFLAGLPEPPGSGCLFGPRISSADVVLAVLCARLTMIGEGRLLQRADLGAWWQRMQQRPAFRAADVWSRFHRRRFLAAVLAARHTPIEP
jgi:glutathione S-transferase